MIRELWKEDLKAYLRLTEQDHVRAFIKEYCENRETRKKRILSHIEYSYRFYECGIWGLFTKDTPVSMAGLVELRIPGENILQIMPDLRDKVSYELGFVTDVDFLGRGIAKEAGMAVIEYAFDYLMADCICLSVDLANEAARRTAVALHFNQSASGLYCIYEDDNENCEE